MVHDASVIRHPAPPEYLTGDIWDLEPGAEVIVAEPPTSGQRRPDGSPRPELCHWGSGAEGAHTVKRINAPSTAGAGESTPPLG
jgi:hypothetical protein